MDDSALPTPPRKRGAPRGNRNALKHGFYASHFDPSEIKDLESKKFTGLKDEIDMMRVCMRRAMQTYQAVEDPAQSTELLRIICLLSTCLTRMIRTQQIVYPRGAEEEKLIGQAIEEVLQNMGCKL